MTTVADPICDVLERSPHTKNAAENLQECILLIEDSEDAMLLVRYAIEDYGNDRYSLKWADTLADGLERLGQGGVDLVLLDLGLPESSGAASFAAVREADSKVPILVLTGDAREQTECAVTAGGVQDYLVKDQVSGALLVEAIRAALQASKTKKCKAKTYKMTQRFHWH